MRLLRLKTVLAATDLEPSSDSAVESATRLADAGRYSFDEALEIIQDANAGMSARNFPSETMCPDWTEETPGAKH